MTDTNPDPSIEAMPPAPPTPRASIIIQVRHETWTLGEIELPQPPTPENDVKNSKAIASRLRQLADEIELTL